MKQTIAKLIFFLSRRASNIHHLVTLGLAVRADKTPHSWRVVIVQLKLHPHPPMSTVHAALAVSDRRPCDRRPCNRRPCDTRPCNRRPCDKRPCDRRPCDRRPCDRRPCDRRPCDRRPCDTWPCHSRPCDRRPCDRRPCDRRPCLLLVAGADSSSLLLIRCVFGSVLSPYQLFENT